MPRPKIGLFAKNVVDPPRDLTHVRARKKRTAKCLYYLGMAKNFRRVLNCVAVIFCEIEDM